MYFLILNQEFNAKLSDFGLAKAGPTGDLTHVTTRVFGTQGYAAPEYVSTGLLFTCRFICLRFIFLCTCIIIFAIDINCSVILKSSIVDRTDDTSSVLWQLYYVKFQFVYEQVD